ncbi:MAG TPA: hypothetical protein VFJ16_16650 [Longimicrobium sp.]|nr:hypothetical protein [Longimicrobium sp.]
MSERYKKLVRQVGDRFAGREAVSAAVLASEVGVREDELTAALKVLEELFEVPAAWLRPGDRITMLANLPERMSTLDHFLYDVRLGDRELILHEMIDDRLAELGRPGRWPPLVTIGDFVRVWSGHVP